MPLWSWPGSRWYDDESVVEAGRGNQILSLCLLNSVCFCIFSHYLVPVVCVWICVCEWGTHLRERESGAAVVRERTHTLALGFILGLFSRESGSLLRDRECVCVCISDHMSVCVCVFECPVLLHTSYLLLCHYHQALSFSLTLLFSLWGSTTSKGNFKKCVFHTVNKSIAEKTHAHT